MIQVLKLGDQIFIKINILLIFLLLVFSIISLFVGVLDINFKDIFRLILVMLMFFNLPFSKIIGDFIKRCSFEYSWAFNAKSMPK